MFSLLNSWATKNPCLNRVFNFTLVTFLWYFSTVLSVGVRDTQQCCVTAAAVYGQVSLGEPSTGAPERRSYTTTGKVTSFVKILSFSWVYRDSHQNLHGDMSEQLPLHLSSAVKITARSCTKVSRTWVIWGETITHRWHQGEWCVGQRSLHVRLSDVVLVVSVTSWDYNLATELCFKCNFGYFLLSIIFL